MPYFIIIFETTLISEHMVKSAQLHYHIMRGNAMQVNESMATLIT